MQSLKLGNILMQRTGRLIQNSPRLSEDKAVVRFRQVKKVRSLPLNDIDCTVHKQPAMLRHCGTATAAVTEYLIL